MQKLGALRRLPPRSQVLGPGRLPRAFWRGEQNGPDTRFHSRRSWVVVRPRSPWGTIDDRLLRPWIAKSHRWAPAARLPRRRRASLCLPWIAVFAAAGDRPL